MIYHRKRLVLKRLTHLLRLKRIKEEILLSRQANGAILEGEEGDDDLMGLSQMSFIPFGQMDSLSAKERKRLREANKNMPAYLFMTESEKGNFFKKKSENYLKALESLPAMPSRTKKIVKFQNSFEVKPFNHKQPATRIKGTPCFKDSYHPEHFST